MADCTPITPNRYVGLRYVPLIDGQWDNTKAYEPHTVVLNEGNSYTSKTFVPIGVDITNETYWALTGNYNAQVEQYRGEVEAVKEEIAVVDGKVTENTTSIEGLKRNAIYIGNSYAAGGGSSTDNKGIFALTKDMFDNAYLYFDGGTGFVEYQAHTVTFETLLNNAINDSSFSNDSITDIIVIGAWGETLAFKNMGTEAFTSAAGSAIISFVAKVKANFKNADRISYTFAETRGIKTIPNTVYGNSYYSEPFGVHQLLKILCIRNGMEYLGWIGWNTWMRDNMMSADHYHPNDAGYLTIATSFRQAYRGNLEYEMWHSNFSNLSCGVTPGSTIGGRTYLTPETCTITITNLRVGAGSTPDQYVGFAAIDFSTLSYTPPMPYMNEMSVGFTEFILNYTNGKPDESTKLHTRLMLQLSEDKSNVVLLASGYTKETAASATNSFVTNAQIFCEWNF